MDILFLTRHLINGKFYMRARSTSAAHQSVVKLLLVVSAIHSVGPTLVQVPVVVYISNAKALCEGGQV